MGSDAALYPMATRASTDWGAMGLCEPLPSSKQTQFSSIYIKKDEYGEDSVRIPFAHQPTNNNTRRGD